jgi:hypothetical protein
MTIDGTSRNRCADIGPVVAFDEISAHPEGYATIDGAITRDRRCIQQSCTSIHTKL